MVLFWSRTKKLLLGVDVAGDAMISEFPVPQQWPTIYLHGLLRGLGTVPLSIGCELHPEPVQRIYIY